MSKGVKKIISCDLHGGFIGYLYLISIEQNPGILRPLITKTFIDSGGALFLLE